MWVNKSIGSITQPYVFVHLLDDDNIECYILTSADFVSLSKSVYSKMSTVTQGKTAPIKFKWSDLQQYKNKWNNLW